MTRALCYLTTSLGIIAVAMQLGLCESLAASPPVAIRMDEPTFDFGDVSDESPLTHVFHFTNVSGKTITLRRSGCGGFVQPAPDKERYLPGESGTVTVTFYPRGFCGKVARTYSVVPYEVSEPGQ